MNHAEKPFFQTTQGDIGVIEIVNPGGNLPFVTKLLGEALTAPNTNLGIAVQNQGTSYSVNPDTIACMRDPLLPTTRLDIVEDVFKNTDRILLYNTDIPDWRIIVNLPDSGSTDDQSFTTIVDTARDIRIEIRKKPLEKQVIFDSRRQIVLHADDFE